MLQHIERANRLAAEIARETQNHMDDFPLTRDEAIALVAYRHGMTVESLRFALKVAAQNH